MIKISTVEEISNIKPIVGVNTHCKYIIKDKCVVDKVGMYNKGDSVIYCEVDSWIPDNIAPFLTAKNKKPKTYLNIKGQLLKTKKIKGVISRGLILPMHTLSLFKDHYSTDYPLGYDVSYILNIVKYEPTLN